MHIQGFPHTKETMFRKITFVALAATLLSVANAGLVQNNGKTHGSHKGSLSSARKVKSFSLCTSDAHEFTPYDDDFEYMSPGDLTWLFLCDVSLLSFFRCDAYFL